MPLVPPAHVTTREAWMVYGKIASGKSSIWDTTAAAYRKNSNPGRFYIISTEPERAHVIVEQHTDWQENVTIFERDEHHRSFEGLTAVCAKIHAEATRDDWFVIDSLGSCFDWVRDHWFKTHLSLTWGEYQETGKQLVGKNAEVKPEDWIEMNNTYKRWMLDSFFNFPGHRMAVAQADALFEIGKDGMDWDKGHIRDTYGHIGQKPVGYKFDDYYFHSMWYAARNARTNTLTLKTLKDKPGREWMDNAEMLGLPLGFVYSYLLPIAQWTLEAK